MIEDIKLPPLPYPYYTQAYRTTGEVIQDYARAAIKADRQRRGEPVQLCDCERGYNGIGIAVRECDCTGNNPHPSELVNWKDGYRAAMNEAGWAVRELYVNHVHHTGVDGLLKRCQELEQSFIRSAEAAPQPAEQAVLKSPELQALRKDAERIQFIADEGCMFDICVRTDGTTKYRLEWDAGSEWQVD